ncbi:MAG: hypothetical protein AAGG68_06155 [Bacteroidota bacterium]
METVHSFFDQRYARVLIAFVLFACIIYLGYAVDQNDFWQMLPVFALAFCVYVLILRSNMDALKFWIGLAVLLRVALLFGLPNLSDDVYRFIWDGRLLQNGINPFDHLPSYYLQQAILPEGINNELYQQLNSPEYYTIYPPVAQLSFYLATWLFPNSILSSTLVMKFFLFAFECGNIYLLIRLLPKFEIATKNALIYALNPLIVLEITGNLHFEGAMVFFLLLAVYGLKKWEEKSNSSKKILVFSALSFAFSIASKLLPLMFLPMLIKRLGWKKSVLYFVIVGSTVLLLFLPLLSGAFLQNFGNSLDLYFRKFEFNASIYYLIRWIGFQLKGFNLIAKIGPALALGTLLGISILSFREKKPTIKHLPLMMLFAICIYLSFTTTVHPWYISLPLVLCCFTSFRFPVLWSGLIFLTYINYSYTDYQENLWIVAVEYLLVWSYFLWELRTKFFQRRTFST